MHHEINRQWLPPLVLSLVASVTTVANLAAAQSVSPGALEPNFGNAGARIVAQSGISAGGEFRAIKTQPDGKLVAGGTIANAAGTGVMGMIARFTPTGALDSAFGVGGIVNLPMPPCIPTLTQFVLNDIALTPDGKIVFTGEGVDSRRMSITGRLTASGAPDATFGPTACAGQLGRKLPGFDIQGGQSVGVQSNGDLVVLSYLGASDGSAGYHLDRWKANGAADSSFVESTTVYPGGVTLPNSMLIHPDDTFSFSVSKAVPSHTIPNTVSIQNRLSNGSSPLIPGNATATGANDTAWLQTIAFDSTGAIMSTGAALVSGDYTPVARRHNASGVVSATFTNGLLNANPGVALQVSAKAPASGRGIHQLANGDLIVSGFVRAGSSTESWFTSRMSPTGSAAVGGYPAMIAEIKPNNQNGRAWASTLAHDEGVVLAGYLTDPGNGRDYPAIAKVAVSGTSTNDTEVVEYYSPSLVKYFMTAKLNEKQALDQPNAAGLGRTGFAFKAYSATAGAGKAVRRFFAFQPGQFSTHFYLTEAADIAAVSAQPWATDEGISMYFTTPTVVGTNRICPTGNHNIWRVFKQKANPAASGTDPNHRYVRTAAALADMLTKGYSDEGIVFCGRL